VGETFNRFADFGILGSELHKNAFGGRTRWEGELYRSPDPLAVIMGRGGMARGGKGWEKGGEGREGKDVKG